VLVLQRKLIAPAFSSQSVKGMVPIFSQKAEQLCNQWRKLLKVEPVTKTGVLNNPREKSASIVVDVVHWISRASFDVIGLAGFDYQFDSLDEESEEVYNAYRKMFDALDKGSELRAIAELYFPVIRKIWVCISYPFT
jgi:cytochrome P450